MVMTPAMAMFVTLEADKLDPHESAGTIARQLEQAAGPRQPGDWRDLMGPELYAAYAAVNVAPLKWDGSFCSARDCSGAVAMRGNGAQRMKVVQAPARTS